MIQIEVAVLMNNNVERFDDLRPQMQVEDQIKGSVISTD